MEAADDDRLIFLEEHYAFNNGDHNEYPYMENLTRPGDMESGLARDVRRTKWGVSEAVQLRWTV